jgi:hypothetical protein
VSDLLGRMIARATRVLSPVEPIRPSMYASEAPLLEKAEGPESPPVVRPAAVTMLEEASPRSRTKGVPADVSTPAGPVGDPRERIRTDTGESAVHTEHMFGKPPTPVPVRARISSRPSPEATSHLDQPAERIESITVRARETPPRMPEPPAESAPRDPFRTDAPALTGLVRTDSPQTNDGDPQRAQPVEVHVSIGHIEVRAAAPVTPSRPARVAPRPRVSLDDYLRRRNQEHR